MNILITGGSSDIAKAIAERQAANGDRIFLTASTSESLAATLEEYQKNNISASGFVFNFGNPVASQKDLQTITEMKIDTVVLNAFERMPTLKRLHELEFDVASSYIERQVRGNLWLIHQLLPSMSQQKFGRLVLISSVSAGIGTSNYGIYCAAKAALEGLFLNLAVDYGRDNVLANIVRLGLFKTTRTRMFWRRPGYVDKVNQLIPQGKMGEPSQAAEALVPLISPTSYMNGTIVNVSGGLPLSCNS